MNKELPIATSQSHRRRRTKTAIAAVGIVLILLVFVRTQATKLNDPLFKSRHVSEWFDAYLMASLSNEPHDLLMEFHAMGGEAVPYLAGVLDSNPSLREKGYNHLLELLPNKVSSLLPDPFDLSFYGVRQRAALDLLKEIGNQQKFAAAEGDPIPSHSIATAIPAIERFLRVDESAAATALWWIGAESAPAVPSLISSLSSSNKIARIMATQALGGIGAAASNAVPKLIEIASDEHHDCRRAAVVSIGQIGPPAVAALPLLTDMLAETDGELRPMAVRSIAAIGTTPADSIIDLEELSASTNQIVSAWAALALWNAEPESDQRWMHLIQAIKGMDKPTPLLSILPTDTRTAIRLSPYVKPLTTNDDINVRHYAKRFLYNLELAEK